MNNQQSLLNKRNLFLSPLETVFDNFFTEFFNENTAAKVRSKGTYPKIDAWVLNDKYIVEATVPGIDNTNDVEVELLPGNSDVRVLRIAVKGESRKEDVIYNHKEICRSYSERLLTLPQEAQGEPEATLKNGILRVSFDFVPQKPKLPEKRLIQVNKQ